MIKRIESVEALGKKVKCKSNYIDESRAKGEELVFKMGYGYNIIGRVSQTNQYLVDAGHGDVYLCDADDTKFLFEIED